MGKIKKYDLIATNGIKALESDLKDLSMKMIKLLGLCKDKGMINEQEYQQHIRLKTDFLQNLNDNKPIK